MRQAPLSSAAAFGLRSNAAAFGLRPSAGKARLLLIALFAASCSYSDETAQIFVQVDAIPTAADHLDVVLTPSDTTVVGRNCPTSLIVAANAICYRPTFQPQALNAGSLDLAFAAPAPAGTFTVRVTASDRNLSQLAQGTASCALPCPVNLHVTLN